MMLLKHLFVFVFIIGVVMAYRPGQYVPKSFYIIDPDGHQSEPVFIRNRRDIMDHPLFRVRRGGGSASASSHASASASSNSGAGGYSGGDFAPNFAAGTSNILDQVQKMLNNIPGPSGAGGAYSFAGSSASNSAGNGAGGPSSGFGSGHQAEHNGPELFSRFGEAEGTGIHVSGQAQGTRGAFASTSSQIDDQGKIKYSVQSGKF